MSSTKGENRRRQDILGRLAMLEARQEATQDTLAEVHKDVKALLAWMNRGKGWAAAAMLVGAAIGSLFGKLLGFFGAGKGGT